MQLKIDDLQIVIQRYTYHIHINIYTCILCLKTRFSFRLDFLCDSRSFPWDLRYSLKKNTRMTTDAVLAFLQILFLKCSADIYVNWLLCSERHLFMKIRKNPSILLTWKRIWGWRFTSHFLKYFSHKKRQRSIWI